MRAHPCPPRNPTAFLSLVILVPVERIQDSPAYARVLAFAAALVSAVLADLFTGMLALLCASSAVDYYVGRKVARLKGKYRPEVARAGAYSKVGGILLLLLVRFFTFYLARHGILDTRGFVATGLAVGLFVVDLESIEHHRKRLGARPIPGLSQALGWMRGLQDRMLPPDPPAAATGA